MMRSIPPKGSIPQNIKKRSEMRQRQQIELEDIETRYKLKRYMPHYNRMHTKTLERLLSDAKELESKLITMIKLDPSDEMLEKLDKVQRVISQLNVQIHNRRR